ncbi:Hypothetical predicted protein [Mytilus galloprovincialis]|uniref:DZIP3-like HEPN domain-containing protein n=1 Tax=Mytilus galloprovincialis TaxID=29158 RepID=A0A8B6D7N9_MYTGA|nr:Hypothetical predicted protein [Mytilus galloprovincialis]
MCDSTGCSYITHQTIPSYIWQFLFNIPSSNVCKKTTTPHICFLSPTAGQTPEHLDDEYIHILHKQFCSARKALDTLVNYRNVYGHTDKTHLPVAEYQKVKTNIEKAIMILPKLPGKKEQTREKLNNFEKTSLDVVLTCTDDIKEEIRNKHREQNIKLDHVKVEIKEEISDRHREQDSKLDRVEEKVLRAEISRNFYNVYMFAASLFIKKGILSLSVADTSHLCDDGAKFKIKPASYPAFTVFMSLLTGGWIRFSDTEEKYTKFKLNRVTNINGGNQFYHIESVDYPKYYLTMGYCGWWVRAKFYEDQPIDDDAIWDIRCLKTDADSLYLLVPKKSEDFMCVDCTRRLKGSCGVLDVSKMFLFEKV